MPCKTFRNLILLISFFFVLLSPQHDIGSRIETGQIKFQFSEVFANRTTRVSRGRSSEQLCLVIRAEIPVYIMSALVTIANNNVFFYYTMLSENVFLSNPPEKITRFLLLSLARMFERKICFIATFPAQTFTREIRYLVHHKSN